jgi:hypothetical protein
MVLWTTILMALGALVGAFLVHIFLGKKHSGAIARERSRLKVQQELTHNWRLKAEALDMSDDPRRRQEHLH